MKPTETCSKCGQGAYHNQGISKTKFSPEYPNGIPYENIKCGNPACKFIQWIDIKGSPKPQNSHQDGWSVLGDTLGRMELKIDSLLDILKPEKPILPKGENGGDFKKLGDILPKYAETEIPIVEDEGIKVSEISF